MQNINEFSAMRYQYKNVNLKKKKYFFLVIFYAVAVSGWVYVSHCTIDIFMMMMMEN